MLKALGRRSGWAVSLMFGSIALAEPAALEEYDGSRGVWLKTNSIEAFVATQPKFRVLAVRKPGAASLLATSAAPQQGVRLAFMEPGQIPRSFDVGDVPAEVVEQSVTAVRVRLTPAVGLQYEATIELDPALARVMLKLKLTNVAAASRRVACWSVLSFSREPGVFVVPYGQDAKTLRRFVFPWWTAWPQPGVQFGQTALAFDVAAPLAGTAAKVGVTTETGWAALLRAGRGLVVRVPYEVDGVYPEGGANVTLFASADGWCEIEHVGPLRRLNAGESTEMTQMIDLVDVPSAPPDLDAVRIAIEKSWPAK